MTVDGWRAARLEDAVALRRGHDLPANKRVAGDVPVLGSFGVTGYHDSAIAQGPGVTIGRSGASFGVVSFSGKDYWPLNTALYVTNFRGNDERFVYYLLKTIDLRRFNSGSAQPSLNRNYLRGIPVLVPPLSEQRAIAGVLGALDDKIELNRRMSETLEALARQHHRAVVRRGAQQKSLGELVLVNARKRSRDFEYEEIEYVDISSVKAGYLDVPSPLRIEEAPSRAQRLVADGDTIWSCVRPNRRSYAFIDNPPANRVVSTGFAVLTPLVVPPGFLYLAVTTDDFVDYLSANADGSAYPAVRPEHFERAEIPVPGEDALRSFEAMARPLLARIAHNDRESRTLADLRDALLPKLISGELRVRDAEAAVDVAEPT